MAFCLMSALNSQIILTKSENDTPELFAIYILNDASQ